MPQYKTVHLTPYYIGSADREEQKQNKINVIDPHFLLC